MQPLARLVVHAVMAGDGEVEQAVFLARAGADIVQDVWMRAGHFIRQYQKTWAILQGKSLKGVKNNFNDKKKIKIVGVPKNISQAKYVGHLIKELYPSQVLENTAIVLGSEKLLNPLLNALPREIGPVNVTMGYPLNKTSLSSLFSQYFELYINQNSEGWFYQNILDFLSHPYIHRLLRDYHNLATTLAEEIKAKNWTILTPSKLKRLVSNDSEIPKYLFAEAALTPKLFLDNSIEMIGNLKKIFQDSNDDLGLEYLYHFYTLFNQLIAHQEKYPFINDLKALYSLYNELIRTETLDFEGGQLHRPDDLF